MKFVIIYTTEFTDSLAELMVFCIPPELTFTELLTFSDAPFGSPAILDPILDAIPLGSCNSDKLSTELPN